MRGKRGRRLLIACAVLLVLLALGSLVLALGRGGGGVPAGSKELSATATLSSQRILFGDTVQATLDLVLPRGAERGAINGHPDFSPFQIVSRSVSRADLGGGLERISLHWGLACLTAHCLAEGPIAHMQFTPTFVSIPGRRLRAVWPPLVEVSRAQDVTTPVTAGLDAGPAVAPGLQPRSDAYEALIAAGVSLVVLLAAWLVVRRRVRRRIEARLHAETLLQALLTRVEAGLPEDVLYRQRHALDALAVELRQRHIDSGFAVRAQRLAWAPENPDPEEIRLLVAQVRKVAER